MTKYKSYLLRQLGLKEKKTSIKEDINGFGKLTSPTARMPQVLGLAIRGSSTGGLPSGKMPTLGPTVGPTSLVASDTVSNNVVANFDMNTPSAFGGYSIVKPQTPNSIISDKTPKNATIDSAEPVANSIYPTPAQLHPDQIQKIKDEPVQALTGTSDNPLEPMGENPETEQDMDISLKSACPSEITPNTEKDEEEGKEENDEEAANQNLTEADSYTSSSINQKNLDETFNRHLKFIKKTKSIPSDDSGLKKIVPTLVNESYTAPFSRMRGLANIGDVKLSSNGLWEVKSNECTDCGCDMPNTIHDKKTKKFTEKQVKKLKEHFLNKSKSSTLTEEESKMSKYLNENFNDETMKWILVSYNDSLLGEYENQEMAMKAKERFIAQGHVGVRIYKIPSNKLSDTLKKLKIKINENFNDEKLKSFKELKTEHDPNGTNHDLTLKCAKCGNTQTCRCTKPKKEFKGICDKCAGLENS